MIVNGTKNYGQLDGASAVGSGKELEHAVLHKIPIIPLKVEATWPPEPSDSPGRDCCKVHLGPSLLYVDAQDLDVKRVAREVRNRLTKIGI